MEITVLCKVVDNYGDIGVAFRMVKQLKKIENNLEINLIVDDLKSFRSICDSVDERAEYQKIFDVNVYNWNEQDFCYKTFKKNDGEKLQIILELFQCGRPDWMEKILFEDKLQRTVQIIMIDYLTAEKYAEDFHCLESLTRSKKVQKVNFMPGFTSKTGGLVIDGEWKEPSVRDKTGPAMVFTYERDWNPLVEALKLENKKVLVGQGRGLKSFIEAVEKSEYKADVCVLDYINQDEWDKTMKKCSVLFIRGEESLSRACLSGIPFVWHAYPQSDEYQLVKVKALLERMSECFNQGDFEIIQKVWLDFNKPCNEVDNKSFEEDCRSFIRKADELEYGFSKFAQEIRKNGDLCVNLMTFIRKICIMN